MASIDSCVWLSGAPGRPRTPAEAGLDGLANVPPQLAINKTAGLEIKIGEKNHRRHKDNDSDVALSASAY